MQATAATPRGAAVPASADRPGGFRTALMLSSLAAATVAFGLIGDAAGVGLGTALPPFFATWSPEIGGAAILWLLLLAASTAGGVALARGFGGPLLFVAGATTAGLFARLALAASRDGTAAWYAMFGVEPEAANEYLPALAALDLGLGTLLDRFAEISPSLPIHPSAHPPGTLLLLDWLGIETPQAMAALIIAIGLLAVPLTYLFARRLDFEEGRARAAALLLAFSPAAMIYGVSSADSVFMTLGLIAALLLCAGGPATRIAGAAALAVASFFSWALLAIGAFSALLVAQREGLRRAIAVALAAGVALLAFYLGLYAVSGYDPLGVLAAANEAYELGISNARPWEYWVFGSPVAFFVALGLPVSWYAARAVGIGNEVAVALAVIVAVSALLGFSKAETERIWLFMAPLGCLAAAAIVPRRSLVVVIPFLASQAVVMELTLETIW